MERASAFLRQRDPAQLPDADGIAALVGARTREVWRRRGVVC
jgi:hypothetical protein